MTASSMTISGAKDSSAKVSVKTVLNLVQLEIAERKPQIDVVLQQSKTSQTTAVAGAESKPATTPIAQTSPTQKPAVQQVATPSTPVANTPIVATSTPAKPEKTEKPSVVKPSEKPEKVASVASPKPEKTTEKVVPAQTAKTETVTKPSTSATKQVAQSSNGVSSKQINGTKTANYSVRVGKFDYHENAQKLLNILNSHGYSAWMKTYSHKGKRTYWVYVGTFESKDKAEAFASSMQKELSYIDDYVILGVKNGLRRNS
jgi:septal ring-binding cell division protein DamX